MSITPEQLAREGIDRLFTLAGWVLQDKDQFDRSASEGVAVREFLLPNGECDYLLPFKNPPPCTPGFEMIGPLRGRLRQMPPLDVSGLRGCQIGAVKGLETSLALDNPKAPIQMAAGAGKTFTACTFSWRLLNFAKAKRVLFLVDRNNLGEQTLKEYQNYDPPGSGRKFTDTYITSICTANGSTRMPRFLLKLLQRAQNPRR